MRPLFTALTASAFALSSAAAHAQSTCDDELIRQANDARRAGHDSEALPLFQRAWSTCHTPRALAQVGLTEAALGRWLDADRDLSAALVSREDPWIARNLPRLSDALAQVAPHLPQEMVPRVADAAAPVSEAAPTRPPQAPAPVAPPAMVPVVRAPTEPATEPAGRGGGAQRALAWTSLALGAVAVGGATAALVLRGEEVSAFNDDRACGANGGRVLGGDACAARFERSADFQTLAIAGFGVGGALAVTAVILFATAPRRPSPHAPSAHIACSPSFATPGVTCGATF